MKHNNVNIALSFFVNWCAYVNFYVFSVVKLIAEADFSYFVLFDEKGDIYNKENQ